jgi:hypothetical protein
MKGLISSFLITLRIISTKRFVLAFLNGFIVAVLLYFYVEDNYESKLFEALAENVRVTVAQDTVLKNKEESLLIHSLDLVYQLENSRSLIFKNHSVDSWKSNFIEPVSYDLMTGKRACGGFSMVLARLLKSLDVEVRIPQMQVGETQGGHIIVEAKTSKGWVVLDPSFNVYFRKANGDLASFNDVQKNWDTYKSQIRSGYNYSYRYEGVRYTNWGKIPVVLPLLKQGLTLMIGKERTSHFSMRAAFLRKFNLLFKVTFVLYLVTLFLSVKFVIRRAQEKASLEHLRGFSRLRVAAKTA